MKRVSRSHVSTSLAIGAAVLLTLGPAVADDTVAIVTKGSRVVPGDTVVVIDRIEDKSDATVVKATPLVMGSRAIVVEQPRAIVPTPVDRAVTPVIGPAAPGARAVATPAVGPGSVAGPGVSPVAGPGSVVGPGVTPVAGPGGPDATPVVGPVTPGPKGAAPARKPRSTPAERPARRR